MHASGNAVYFCVLRPSLSPAYLTYTALLLDQYKPNEGFGFFPVFRLNIVYFWLLLAPLYPARFMVVDCGGLLYKAKMNGSLLINKLLKINRSFYRRGYPIKYDLFLPPIQNPSHRKNVVL